MQSVYSRGPAQQSTPSVQCAVLGTLGVLPKSASVPVPHRSPTETRTRYARVKTSHFTHKLWGHVLVGLRLRPTVVTFRWIMDSQLVHHVPTVVTMPSRLGQPHLYATNYSTDFDSHYGSYPQCCTTFLSTALAFRASSSLGSLPGRGLGHCCQWREKSFDL